MQELKPNDLPQDRIFGEWSLRKLAKAPLLYWKILFSYEAHFWLNVYLNKHNCWFWSKEQPEELQKLSMHSSRNVVRFIGFWHYWTVLLQRCRELHVTVNGEHYREMISNFFFFCPKCKNLSCMTCHMPHSTRNNGLIERRVRWTFYFTIETGKFTA